MTFSPRFYDFIGSFAPKGKAGMYMGLAFVPSAIGAWIGGQVSGPLIKQYLPKEGPRNPLLIWSIYASLGLVCAAAMLVYRQVTLRAAPTTSNDIVTTTRGTSPLGVNALSPVEAEERNLANSDRKTPRPPTRRRGVMSKTL